MFIYILMRAPMVELCKCKVFLLKPTYQLYKSVIFHTKACITIQAKLGSVIQSPPNVQLSSD